MRTTKLNRLTELNLKNAKPNAILSDGGGLYLRNLRWVFRATSPVTGKEFDLPIGARDNVTLKAARAKASEFRALIAQKIDPRDHIAALLEQAKAEAAKNICFIEVAEKWMEAKLPERRGIGNQKAVRTVIVKYTKPFAHVPMAQVTSGTIADALLPLKDRPAQRVKVVSAIHSIAAWAMAMGIIPEALNPARRSKMDLLMPASAATVRSNRFVPLDQLPGFMERLSAVPGTLARALEFTFHSGLRQHEVRHLLWDWINLDTRWITVPAAIMKGKRDHQVFLSTHAYAIIMSMLPLRRPGGLVFAGGGLTGMVGERSLRTFLEDHFADLGAVQIHGSRAALRTWAATTLHRRELIEITLAHNIGAKVESAYFNSAEPAIRKAREALYADWSAFLTGGAAAPAANVLAFAHAAQQ
jgi:integrase